MESDMKQSNTAVKQINTANCDVCNEIYIVNRFWQKTCSPKCGQKLQNDKIARFTNTGNCARCNKSLLNRRKNVIYCSKTCCSMDQTFKHRGKGARQLSIARRRIIIERDKSTCYMCHSYVDYKDVELDHVLPRSRGGDSSPRNISVSCFKCNRSKGDSIGIEQLNRLRELRDSNDY